MWNVPSESRLSKIPRLYETENIKTESKLIHLHFFLDCSDFYIAEYDGDDLFWGFAILKNDFQCAEWGYIRFSELRSINIGGLEIDCELDEYWTVKKASEIKRITQCRYK